MRARVLCYLSIDGTCNFMLDIKDVKKKGCLKGFRLNGLIIINSQTEAYQET